VPRLTTLKISPVFALGSSVSAPPPGRRGGSRGLRLERAPVLQRSKPPPLFRPRGFWRIPGPMSSWRVQSGFATWPRTPLTPREGETPLALAAIGPALGLDDLWFSRVRQPTARKGPFARGRRLGQGCCRKTHCLAPPRNTGAALAAYAPGLQSLHGDVVKGRLSANPPEPLVRRLGLPRRGFGRLAASLRRSTTRKCSPPPDTALQIRRRPLHAPGMRGVRPMSYECRQSTTATTTCSARRRGA